MELIKEELGNLLWKAVDEENVTEIKEMLTNCDAYVDKTSQIEGYEGIHCAYKDGYLRSTR